MKIKCVSALFDISRETLGDGRTMEQYLTWFEKTLKLNCDFVVFTEEKYHSFVQGVRLKSAYSTDIIIQKLESLPKYELLGQMSDIMKSEQYSQKMKDTARIECYLPEYNIIQYSKFDWLYDSHEKYKEGDYFFWVDAGCSRFFDDHVLSRGWPDISKINAEKITIQCNENFIRMFDGMRPEDYIWDNNCMLVGTMFGVPARLLQGVKDEINSILAEMLKHQCVNNEQIALAILAKKDMSHFDMKFFHTGGHLPLINYLAA